MYIYIYILKFIYLFFKIQVTLYNLACGKYSLSVQVLFIRPIFALITKLDSLSVQVLLIRPFLALLTKLELTNYILNIYPYSIAL